MRGLKIGVVLTFIFIIISFTKVNVKADEAYLLGKNFGNIREYVVINQKEVLAVSTNNYLYLFEDDTLLNVYTLNEEPLYLEVIQDINNNGYDELLIITQDVLLYDTLEDELLFDYVPKMEAYDPRLGYYENRVPVEDYKIVNHNLFFVAGYNIISLNLETGKEDWKVVVDNNLWSLEFVCDMNQDLINDIVVSLQPSFVMGISSESGEILFKQDIKSNIWSMDYDPQRKQLFLASEEGKVIQYDPINQQIINKINVYNGNNRDFKKMNVKLVDDFTGDNKKDLLFFQATRPFYYKKELSENTQAIIYTMDGNDLEIINEIPLISNSYGISYLVSKNLIYVLDDLTEESITYKTFNLGTQKYESHFTIQNDRFISSYHDRSSYFSFLPNNKQVVFGNYSLIFIDSNHITKEIPITKVQDFYIQDNYLLKTRSYQYKRSFISFEMVNLKNDQQWTYHTRVSKLDYSRDLTGDGVWDLVLLEPNLSLIDGKTGELLSEFVIVSEISSYGPYQDFNYFIITEDDQLIIFDFKNELKTIHNNFSFSGVMLIQDQNRFIELEVNQSIHVNWIMQEDEVFERTTIDTIDEELLRVYNDIGDIDFDGLDDLAFTTAKNNEYTFHLYSSRTGREIISIPCLLNDDFYLSDIDGNGDGYRELFRVNNNYTQNESIIFLYDISENKVLFQSDGYEPSYSFSLIKPAALFIEEGVMKIVLHSIFESNSTLEVYDINQNIIGETSGKKTLGDIKVYENDASTYFYTSSRDTQPFLYNYTENKMEFYYPYGLNKVWFYDENVLIQNNYFDLIETALPKTVEVNLKDEQEINTKYHLKFTKEEDAMIYLYVDNQLVGKTDDEEYTLNLLKGPRTIEIRQVNKAGLESVLVLEVNVVENHFSKIMILSLTVLMLVAVYFTQRKRKIRVDEDD